LLTLWHAERQGDRRPTFAIVSVRLHVQLPRFKAVKSRTVGWHARGSWRLRRLLLLRLRLLQGWLPRVLLAWQRRLSLPLLLLARPLLRGRLLRLLLLLLLVESSCQRQPGWQLLCCLCLCVLGSRSWAGRPSRHGFRRCALRL
jgi:hypothetical protein